MVALSCINQSILSINQSSLYLFLLICFWYILSTLTKLAAPFSKCHCGLSPGEQLPKAEATTQSGMLQNNGGGLLKGDLVLGELR